MLDPLVSVVMAVYNGQLYLEEAVDSILNQTYRNIEFIIIDDASTDNSLAIIKGYIDIRIKIIHNTTNMGLARSLNRGLDAAEGDYIARMDADDISLPNRIEQQLRYMEKFQDIGVLGTFCTMVSPGGQQLIRYKKPVEDIHIRWQILLENPFIHPSVMLRRSIIKSNNLYYNEDYITSQDYELWTRVLQVSKGANIPKSLMFYRVHEKGISSEKRQLQFNNSSLIAQASIENVLGILPDREKLQALQELLLGNNSRGAIKYGTHKLLALYNDLYSAYQEKYPEANSHILIQREVNHNDLTIILTRPVMTKWVQKAIGIIGRNPVILIKYIQTIILNQFKYLGRTVYRRN